MLSVPQHVVGMSSSVETAAVSMNCPASAKATTTVAIGRMNQKTAVSDRSRIVCYILYNPAIRPSVCPGPRRAAVLGYGHAGCADCGPVRGRT